MTAVFAFVFDGAAVIATDTLRVDPFGWLPNQTVPKSYCWKELIPFGAAGSGAFVKRIADRMALSEANYSPDKDGFLAAFDTARHEVLDAINNGSNALERAVAHATILAAIPALGSPAHILKIDFATGAVEEQPLTFAAEGTSPSDFHAVAETRLTDWLGSALDVEALTIECMQLAIALCPGNVGWPMDLRIVEPGANPQATVTRLGDPNPEGSLPSA